MCRILLCKLPQPRRKEAQGEILGFLRRDQADAMADGLCQEFCARPCTVSQPTEHEPRWQWKELALQAEALVAGCSGLSCPGREISGLQWITSWPVQCLPSFAKRVQSWLRARDPGDGCGLASGWGAGTSWAGMTGSCLPGRCTVEMICTNSSETSFVSAAAHGFSGTLFMLRVIPGQLVSLLFWEDCVASSLSEEETGITRLCVKLNVSKQVLNYAL